MAARKKRVPQATRQKEAFSLLELLTVLGIVGVLAAIVFPVFFAVRENGRKTICTSNLRQIGHAFSQYVSDYDGVFPGAVSGTPYKKGKEQHVRGRLWTKSLFPYMGGKYLACPDREVPGALAEQGADSEELFESIITGYAANYYLSEEISLSARNGAFRISGKAETLFRYPALTVLIFDARTSVGALNYPDVYPWRKSWSPEARAKWDGFIPQVWVAGNYDAERRAQKGGAQRHSGGANYVFADGHVKWLKPEQISPAPQSDGIHPGFGL